MNTPNATVKRRRPRAYHSQLRQHQSEQTRELILEAVAQLIAEAGVHQFTLPKVAERAGIATRTVFRHFGNRDDIVNALDEWLDSKLRHVVMPTTIDGLADLMEHLFAAFDEHPLLVQALLYWRFSEGMGEVGRAGRVQLFGDLLNEVTSNLEPDEAGEAHAVIAYLASSLAWLTLRQESGLHGPSAGKAIGWAIRTLVAELRRENAKRSRVKKPDAIGRRRP